MPVTHNTRKKQYRALIGISNAVVELDPVTLKQTRYTPAVGPTSYGMCMVSPKNGDFVFMSDGTSVYVYHVSNLTTQKCTVGSFAAIYDIQISPDGKTLMYLGGTSMAFADVSSIYKATPSAPTAPLGTLAINGVIHAVFTPDSSKLIVGSSSSSTSAYIINVASRSITSTVALGTMGWGVAVSPNGNTAYCALSAGDIKVVNIGTGTVSSTITSTGANKYPALTSDGRYLIVPKSAASSVQIIDTTAPSQITTVATVASPLNVSISPDNNYAIVGSSATSAASLINLKTNTATTITASPTFIPAAVCWIAR